jgi:hypothetical protein
MSPHIWTEGGSLQIGGTSRMSREAHVRSCERLWVKLPGPTRPDFGFDGIAVSSCNLLRFRLFSLFCPTSFHSCGDSRSALSTQPSSLGLRHLSFGRFGATWPSPYICAGQQQSSRLFQLRYLRIDSNNDLVGIHESSDVHHNEERAISG